MRALGAKAGGAVMQTWNVLMAAGGAWQNQRQGPKNAKGKTYKPPKDYPTEYARRLAARHR